MKTNMTLEDIYWHGFATKCAEYGIDPEALVKSAQQAVSNTTARASAPVVAKPKAAPVQPIKPIKPPPAKPKPAPAVDYNLETQYKVVPGDTVDAIAKRFDLTRAEFLKMNPHITDPDLIRAGTIVNRF